MRSGQGCRRAFSLIELVLVILIMGVVAAIAIPRVMRGADGADELALKRDLQILRQCIELYTYEHGGVFPEEDSTFIGQLTQYTDIDGDISPVPTATHVFGPYLVKMPAIPVGENKGSTDVRDGGNPGDGDDGWFYDKDTGEIFANTDDDELDSSGLPYNTY